jgi:hypothetical protein
MAPWLEQLLGGLLVLLVLLDVFLTVLYARVGKGIISAGLSRAVWWIFHRLADVFARWRRTVLSLCGPAILVALLIVWTALLAAGSA